MHIVDLKFSQSLGELLGIVLGVSARSRKSSDIDDEADLRSGKSTNSPTERVEWPIVKNGCFMFRGL